MKAAEISAQQEFEARFDATLKKEGIVGCLPIQGIDGIDSEDEEEENGASNRRAKRPKIQLTAEQISMLRYVMVTKSREKAINQGLNFATQTYGDSQIVRLNTYTGNEVICRMPGKINQCMMKKIPKCQQFDKLLGLTYALNDEDFWFYENELWEEGEELDKAIRKLASAWKELLPCSDEELGITDEFTRQGTLRLLEQLREKIDKGNESEVKYCFDYSGEVQKKKSRK